MSTIKHRVVLAGYKEDEWDMWRSSMADGEHFTWSFLEWSVAITGTVSEQRANGHEVVLQTISLADFIAFAKSQELPLTADSRSLYATSIAY